MVAAAVVHSPVHPGHNLDHSLDGTLLLGLEGVGMVLDTLVVGCLDSLLVERLVGTWGVPKGYACLCRERGSLTFCRFLKT